MQNNRIQKTEYIENLLRLPGIYFFLLKSVRKQIKFLKNELEPGLEPFRRENDGSLTEAHLKKINGYYAMGVPAILGESLCVLRGRPMSLKERLCLSYLGGISGLLDDLFDEPGKSASHLEDAIFSPENLTPASTHENLLKQFYLKGLSSSPHPDKIKNAAFNVFKAQQKSLLQKGSNPDDQIADLTFLKGGNSFLYYRHCMFHELDKREENMVFQLGGFMQLGNDIFDVWEDWHDGIMTIPTATLKIYELRNYFNKEMEKTRLLVHSTSYDAHYKLRFQRMINLAIARVYVCLDQFEKLSASTGGEFRVGNYNRKQLICDMQKPANQLKAIAYYLKTPVK